MSDLLNFLLTHEFGIYGTLITLISIILAMVGRFTHFFYKKIEEKINSLDNSRVTKDEFDRYVLDHKEDHDMFIGTITTEMSKMDKKLDNLSSYQTRHSELLHKLSGEVGARDASIIALIRALEGRLPIPEYNNNL